MRRILLTAVLLLAWASAHADGKHFLWRVSKGDAVMYLAGSVHVLRAGDYPLPAELESAFKSSAGLVEEIDLTHFDAESAQMQMMKIGSYPPGQSLKTALSAPVYKRVQDLAARQRVDMAMLEPMRPWLASIVLLDNQLVHQGYDPGSGVDIHFADEAEAAGKPVIGLEAAEYQLGLLARLSDKAQQDMLLQSLDDAKTVDKDMQTMMAAWRQGDTVALENQLQQEFGPYPEVYRSVVVDRNQTWMPKLESLAASGKTYFVVVGALHLVGPDGLLARFQKDGFKIEQM